jgi:glutathione S-transferase
MAELKLIIGSKTYSSWSLRPWLLLRYHNVAFREVPIALNEPETRARIAEFSPSGKVPVLINGPEKVWESLAICEYAAETLKLPAAWPSDITLKFQARSLACEMHAGFADLRRELPMDCRRAPSPQAYSAAAGADIARIRAIWRECRQAHARNGEWLFGKFGIVDAMFAPVVLRLHAYAVPGIDGPEREYMNTVLNLPALREWLGAAMLEHVTGGPTPGPAPSVSSSSMPKPAPAAAAPHKKSAAPAPVAAPVPAPAVAAPAAPAQPTSGAQLVSNQGGVKVTSNILPPD